MKVEYFQKDKPVIVVKLQARPFMAVGSRQPVA